MYVRYTLSQGFVYGRHRPGLLKDSPRRRYWRRRITGGAGELRDLIAWFNKHLPFPPREAFQRGKGLCWFRGEAAPCLDRIHALARLYRAAGTRILIFEHPEPGTLTYQDAHQVVAVPAPTHRFRPSREVVS